MNAYRLLPWCALIVAGCSTPAPTPTPAPSNPMAQQSTYKGTLPCADCAGIENTLILYRDQYGKPSRYQLTQTYVGGKDKLTVIDRGDWEIRPDNLKQVTGLDEVFVLSPTDANSRTLFLHHAANAIELLGPDGVRATSKLNYTLMLSQ